MSYDDLVQLLRTCDIPDPTAIRPDSRLREDLLLSSFSLMVLIVKLEELLGLEIDPAALEQSATVEGLLSALQAYVLLKKATGEDR